MTPEKKRNIPTNDPTSLGNEPTPLTPSRLILKLGTSLLTGGTEQLDHTVLGLLVQQASSLYRLGWEILIVSSGAVAAGRQIIHERADQNRGFSSRKSPHEVSMRQVQAAVGQSHLMSIYEDLFEAEGISVAQALLTDRDIADRTGYLNIRNTLNELLNLKIIPIINENDVVAIEEIQGEIIGDNDMLSAKLARIVEADLLILLSDIKGLYTADPNLHPDAQLITSVEDATVIEVLAGNPSSTLGTGGMASKLAAAKLAAASGTTAIIADGREPNILIRLTKGEPAGTHFPSYTTHLDSRRGWMLSMTPHTGRITIRSNTLAFLEDNNIGVSATEILKIQGSFQRGDAVQILDQNGEAIAVGIANYGSQEILQPLKGLSGDTSNPNEIALPKIVIYSRNLVERKP